MLPHNFKGDLFTEGAAKNKGSFSLENGPLLILVPLYGENAASLYVQRY